MFSALQRREYVCRAEVSLVSVFLSTPYTQGGAPTQDPNIESHMLYDRASQAPLNSEFSNGSKLYL